MFPPVMVLELLLAAVVTRMPPVLTVKSPPRVNVNAKPPPAPLVDFNVKLLTVLLPVKDMEEAVAALNR